MAYKKGLETFQEKSLNDLKEGKESILLIESNNTLRRMTEHISYVEEVKRGEEGEMSTIKLRFAGNTVIETRAYIDWSIHENILVSTWGFFDEVKGNLKYFCKGGIQRVITKATDFLNYDLEKTYRMGFVELSKPEISSTYLKNEKIEPIEDTGLFYFAGNITEIENNLNNNSVVNTTVAKKRIRFY